MGTDRGRYSVLPERAEFASSTAPKGGDAYYILAHQYIAAALNIVNGTSSTQQVNEALAWAESFFNTYKPSSKLSNTVRSQALGYADLLERKFIGIKE